MNKIRILSDNLANQIAAGEVVERPASVVKEMIENSIDANAKRIDLEVELGGRRLIKVSDDGEGMTRDDAILAFERHATSKIRTQEDLAAIGTLGFRGEALASIASVARVELITKNEAADFATKVIIEGGRLLDVGDAGRDRGTTIVVRDLFFNTPARRKFMRSEATENYHLTSIVTHYSLAHPHIAFSLKNNGREVIRAVPAKDVRERAFQLFGSGLVESLLPVRGSRDFVAGVTGFVSAPRERRTNRDNQFFFVNKRFVRDKILARGLEEGFRSVLPHGVYPVAFLFLEIPLDEVDVNVHPAKTEVRFRRGEAVKDVVAEAVREALLSAGITGDIAEVFEAKSDALLPSRVESPAASEAEQAGIDFHYDAAAQSEPEQARSAWAGTGAPVDIDAAPSIFEMADAVPAIDAAREAAHGSLPVTPAREHEPDFPPVNSAQRFVTQADVEQMSTAKIRPLGQLHDSFIIAVDDEGLLLIDQHVAHERILFDKFRQGEIERTIESQNLLLPETIDLSPAQSQAFRLIESDLAALGFALMSLSGRTIAIKSVPTDLPASEARNLFAEILDSIDAEKKGSAKSTFRDDIAASLACKAAIKINTKLTTEKMRWLIDRLLLTTSPTTCPHGRPVILRLTMKDIERGFHRT